MIPASCPHTCGQRQLFWPLPVASVIGAVFFFLLVAMLIFNARHKRANSRRDELIERMKAVLGSDDLYKNPDAVLEEILGDDKR